MFVFAVAFGTGMGIKTIVQATAAPEFLGRAGYGALQGALMFPVYLAQAGTPLLAAWIWQIHGNYDLLEIVLCSPPACPPPRSSSPPDCGLTPPSQHSEPLSRRTNEGSPRTGVVPSSRRPTIDRAASADPRV